jgi:hypothetical protein
MNEKIKELAEQAREKKFDYGAKDGESHFVYVLNEQKFAELIVRDVVEYYRSQIGETSEPHTKTLEHFGVKE